MILLESNLKKVLKSKIFQNFSWLLADRLIRLALTLVVSVLVARYLGPERFGLWNYLLAFTMFFTVFTGLGFDNVIPRELVNHPDKEREIVSTGFILKFLGSLIGFGLNIGIFILYKNPDKELLVMMSIMASLLIFQSAEIFDYFFKAKLQAKFIVYARNSTFVLVAILKLLMVWMQIPLIYFIATNGLEFFIGGFMIYYYFKKQGHSIALNSIDWKMGRKFLKDGLPMALSGLMILLYMRIDQVMITDMIGEKANGIYSTGVKMIEIVYFLPMALSDSFFPGIVYSKKHEGHKYEKILLHFYSVMTFSSLGIALVMFVFAKPVMNFLFGEAFYGSGAVLQVYSLTLYATFLSISFSRYLVAENYLKIIVIRSFTALAINVILNFLWIPKFGYIGAAYASLVSYYTTFLVMLFFKKTRRQMLLMLMAFNPAYLLEKIKSI